MFCGNCGHALKEGAEFCANCGTSMVEGTREVVNLEDEVYYSKDWIKAKGLAISSLPRFDILITKENFYLLKMPSGSSSTLFLLIGLLIANIIGAVLGAVIGDSRDSNKRSRYRAAWVNPDEKLISREYEKAIYLRIPLETLKNCVSFVKGKRVKITYGSEEIVLKKGKEAFTRLETLINNLS
jgi:hypothetical protein